jgi:hypothetical protein
LPPPCFLQKPVRPSADLSQPDAEARAAERRLIAALLAAAIAAAVPDAEARAALRKLIAALLAAAIMIAAALPFAEVRAAERRLIAALLAAAIAAAFRGAHRLLSFLTVKGFEVSRSG